MSGTTEPIQQPFQRILRKDQSEVLLGLFGNVQQSLSYRRRQIRVLLVQLTDSRYGCITRATRQTFAASQSSSIEAFLFRRQSRSASSATSRPILFRYLKQSATVLAALNTRT